MAYYKCTFDRTIVWRDGIQVGGAIDSVLEGATVTAERFGDALFISSGTRNGLRGWSRPGWFQLIESTEPDPDPEPPPPGPDPVPPPPHTGWRVKHDRERPRGLWRPRLPEVFRLQPSHHVIFTGAMQKLWYRVNFLLTQLDSLLWRKLGGNGLYLFNGGHGFPGHRDHVNNMELERPDPRAPFMLICGGAIVKGRVEGDKLWLNYIDTNKPLPTAEIVIDDGLYYENLTVQADGSNGKFPQGKGKPTYTPLFASRGVYLLLEDLVAV